MKNFPAICIDNFYSDPNKIRDFALTQKFYHSNGKWPGTRTQPLHLINEDFFNEFCYKLFSLFYNEKETNWVVSTMFQLIEPFDENKLSFKNEGWIHKDSDVVMAGIIYLTPDADIDSGTSLYECIDKEKIKNYQPNGSWTDAINSFYKNNVLVDNYEKLLLENKNCYIETARFNNVYNRLVVYDGTTAHRINNVHSGKNSRLTQAFFVEKIKSSQPPLLERHRKFL